MDGPEVPVGRTWAVALDDCGTRIVPVGTERDRITCSVAGLECRSECEGLERRPRLAGTLACEIVRALAGFDVRPEVEAGGQYSDGAGPVVDSGDCARRSVELGTEPGAEDAVRLVLEVNVKGDVDQQASPAVTVRDRRGASEDGSLAFCVRFPEAIFVVAQQFLTNGDHHLW